MSAINCAISSALLSVILPSSTFWFNISSITLFKRSGYSLILKDNKVLYFCKIYKYSTSLSKSLEIINEIEKSQDLIFENLGITPNLFAYPFGENSTIAQKVVSQYFDAAFGQHSGAFSINQKYFIPRFPLNENYGSINRIKDASSVLPFNNVLIEPGNPYQSEPIIRYTLDFNEDSSNINCFISDFQGSFNPTITNLNNKLLVELNRSPVKGRLRFNCTKVNNGIFWFGYQYLVN